MNLISPNFQKLFEASPGRYLVLNPTFTIVAISNAYLKLTSTSRAHLLGKLIFDVFPTHLKDLDGHGCEAFKASLNRVLQDRVPDKTPVQKHSMRHSSSSESAEAYWISVNTPVLAEDGEPIYIIHHMEDVTEFVEAKDEKLDDRFFAVSLDMFCVSGYDGHFKRVNPAFKAVLGYSEEEICDRSYLDFIHPDDIDRTQREVEKQLSTKASVLNFENRYRCKDGTYKLLSWKSAPVGTYMYAAARDITDSRRIEEELRLEKANRMRSEFLATTSHELRTPLNGVIGVASLLAETDLTPEQRQYVEEITCSGNLLLDMIKNILDLAAISNQGMQLTIEEFDFEELFMKVAADFALPSREAGLVFISKLATDVPRKQCGDATRIGQALRTLVDNAIKFTSSGKIEVSCELTPQSSEDGMKMLRIVVKDTGMGMSQEGIKKLFQPFSQVDSSATRRFGGAGLSLAIAKVLIESMQGKIGVESTLGEGSTFWFTIPLEPAEHSHNEKPAPSKVDFQPKTLLSSLQLILIVDDNKSNLLILQRMLGKMGYNACFAMNGLEAVKAVSDTATSFFAIFMDLHMPVMDGLEATKLLRKMGEKYSKIPIIGLTADAQDGTKKKCFEAGMNLYLTKPITMEILKSIFIPNPK